MNQFLDERMSVRMDWFIGIVLLLFDDLLADHDWLVPVQVALLVVVAVLFIRTLVHRG